MNRNKFNTEMPTEHLAYLVLPETKTNALQNQKSYFFSNAPARMLTLRTIKN